MLRRARVLVLFLGLSTFLTCAGNEVAPYNDEDFTASSSEAIRPKVDRDGLSGPRLRLMEGNISSGNRQSYDPGEGARIFAGLKPDIVAIQEFNFGDNSDSSLRKFVDTNFGPAFSYFREDGQIPNGVVSRYPIKASGSWDDTNANNRGLVWAQIDIPGDKDLWMMSVHLLTAGARSRAKQATELVAHLQQNVPAGDYVVLGGDFNTDTRKEPCLSALNSFFVTVGPYPVDTRSNSNTSGNRRKPYDWLIASSELDAREIAVDTGSNSFDYGMVVDTRTYQPITDLAPALSTDSGASNMQHMAIVRDFALPN